MPPVFAEENTLVQRAMAGDADAFGQIYLLHLDAIYRYVFYRSGEPLEAEDLTETVFLKAWEALPSYRNCGFPFSSWLYRIAHNQVVDFHRRQASGWRVGGPASRPRNGRSAETASRPPEAGLPLEPPYEGEPDHGQGDPAAEDVEETVIKFEEAATLAQAVRQLPEEQQQVIVLRFIEGLSHAEIARIMDKTEGACRMVQHRALAALNGILKTVDGTQSESADHGIGSRRI